MRLEGALRRLAPLKDVFAERQVYLRADASSHYARLSTRLQVAVAAAILLALAWLGAASLGWIATSFEARELSREVARLESANRSLRAVAEGIEPPADPRAAAELRGAGGDLAGIREQVQQLQTDLATAQQQITDLQRLATEAESKAATLQEQLARALREGAAPAPEVSIGGAQAPAGSGEDQAASEGVRPAIEADAAPAGIGTAPVPPPQAPR